MNIKFFLILITLLASTINVSIAGNLCKFTFDLAYEREWKRVTLLANPLPQAKVQITFDKYDVMLKKMPILDPDNKKFRLKEAYGWHKEMELMASSAITNSSTQLSKLVLEFTWPNIIDANNKNAFPLIKTHFEKIINQLRNLKTKNSYDIFAQRFLIRYLQDTLQVIDILLQAHKACITLNDNPSEKSAASIYYLYENLSNKLKLLIFSPSLSEKTISERTSTWIAFKFSLKSLKKIRSSIDTAENIHRLTSSGRV